MSLEEHVNQGTFDAALEISARRAQTLHVIRELLVANKDSEALRLMRKHLGVNEAKNSRPRLVKFPRPAPEKGL